MVLALEAVNLVKVYPGNVRALDGLNAEVPLGSLYCLAGPNGAGKTTFVRIASTVSRPTSGSVSIFGYDVVEDAWRVRKYIAVMPQEGKPFNSTLTVFESVYYYLVSRGFSLGEARREALRVLEELDLLEYRDRLIMTLSGGLRRRVLLAMVLAAGTDVVFLDEPTVGLDPVARRSTWGYIRRLSREGQTIIFTTHMLSEAEAVADRILLINGGKRLFEGTPSEAMSKLGYRYKVVTNVGHLEEFDSSKARVYGDLTYFYVEDLETALKVAEEILYEGGQAQIKPVDLEDFFAEVTGVG